MQLKTATAEGLSDYLERNPADARAIIENCFLATKARLAAKAARANSFKKGSFGRFSFARKIG